MYKPKSLNKWLIIPFSTKCIQFVNKKSQYIDVFEYNCSVIYSLAVK